MQPKEKYYFAKAWEKNFRQTKWHLEYLSTFMLCGVSYRGIVKLHFNKRRLGGLGCTSVRFRTLKGVNLWDIENYSPTKFGWHIWHNIILCRAEDWGRQRSNNQPFGDSWWQVIQKMAAARTKAKNGLISTWQLKEQCDKPRAEDTRANWINKARNV